MLGKIEFGKYLLKLRKNLGLSQEELAERVGVHLNTISQWENGIYTPKTEKIKKLANALNLTEAELLNGPVKQEFEVKILMGVKTLPNVAGLEIKNNSFFFGVDDNEPQIHLGGKVVIGTLEERKEAAEKLLKKFWEACWMYDHKGDAEKDIGDFASVQPA